MGESVCGAGYKQGMFLDTRHHLLSMLNSRDQSVCIWLFDSVIEIVYPKSALSIRLTLKMLCSVVCSCISEGRMIGHNLALVEEDQSGQRIVERGPFLKPCVYLQQCGCAVRHVARSEEHTS